MGTKWNREHPEQHRRISCNSTRRYRSTHKPELAALQRRYRARHKARLYALFEFVSEINRIHEETGLGSQVNSALCHLEQKLAEAKSA